MPQQQENNNAISEWRCVTLGECSVINESAYSPKEAWSFINYLDTGNITDNSIASVQKLIAGKDKIPSRARRKALKGDIVFSTVRPNQRHFGLLGEVPDNFLVSTGFAVIRGKSKIADTGYLYRFLSQPRIVEQLHSIAENSTSAYPAIRPSDIEDLDIKLPPLPEQRRIAEILGALDDKIELNRRMNETLDEMARAIFKDWFVDFGPVRAKIEGRDAYLPDEMWSLFPDRLADSELGEIPEGWEVKRLGDIALLNPESWKKSTAPLEIEYVELANTKWGVIKSTKHFLYENAPSSAKRVLHVGDTIVGTVRPGNGSYSIVGREGLTGSTGFAVMRPKEQMYQQFVYLAATSPSNIERMSHHADGTTYPTIRPDFVAETKAALPCMCSNVMACFSSMTAPMFNRMEANLTESRTLANLRDTLLPKLVSGEVRVDVDSGSSPE